MDFPSVSGSISIHAPRERSDGCSMCGFGIQKISIHAPRERSDMAVLGLDVGIGLFQSTLLVRGATVKNNTMSLYHDNFNPRSS